MHDFQQLFGAPATIFAEAPGRVNLIGEHTDYNGGFVLPTPIPPRCRCSLRIRNDDLVHAWSANQGGSVAEYRLGAETPTRIWLDYVQGCTQILARRGHRLRGFDLRVHSEVPLGSGLSSSAALNVCLLRGLREAFELNLDDLALAQIAQRVENDFVGARVGIMDPLAASLGQTGMALFVDARELTWRHVPLPKSIELVVINSGIKHQHSAGDYNTRRAECEAACRLLGVSQLRDLTSQDLDRVAQLPESLNRRARHVITENERVLQAVVALETGDASELGRLCDVSHQSQRDDYEVSIPALDRLVRIACIQEGVYGARLTGGGFGGSIVVLAKQGRGAEVGASIVAAYGDQALVLLPERSP